MNECAFCMKQAKMSGEHIHSDWMNTVMPGPWKREINSSEGIHTAHDSPQLNWKVKVVCEPCNNGWMSNLENKHAKPVLTPLIAGEVHIPISQSSAHSIALFAFKTAIIADLLRKQEGREPFFSRRIRAAFRKTLDIPASVNMWMCAYATNERRADVLLAYYKTEMPLIGPFELYVCTYAAGGFAFQVVSIKSFGLARLAPNRSFDRMSIAFWPKIRPNFVWPPQAAIRSIEEFIQYHRRWESVTAFSQ